MHSWQSVTVGDLQQVLWDIQLNNCGFYRGNSSDIPASRPEGRPDHHIIFVERGLLTVEIGGQKQVAHRDEFVYFPPNVPQYYCYAAGEDALYYWLHFSGTKIDALWQQLPFQHRIYRLKRLTEYTALLRSILQNADLTRPGAAFLCHAQTQQLLAQLGQEVFAQSAVSKNASRVAQIAADIRSDPVTALSNQDLARKYGISEYHLIRTFKEETGLPPGKYRNRMLIAKAKQLLLDTQLNVNEISYMLGFSDPLYFSRLFKKVTGSSPNRFRSDRTYAGKA